MNFSQYLMIIQSCLKQGKHCIFEAGQMQRYDFTDKKKQTTFIIENTVTFFYLVWRSCGNTHTHHTHTHTHTKKNENKILSKSILHNRVFSRSVWKGGGGGGHDDAAAEGEAKKRGLKEAVLAVTECDDRKPRQIVV